jgi:hypothetical protein
MAAPAPLRAAGFLGAALFVAIAAVGAWHLASLQAERHVWAWSVAGFFVAAALPIALLDVRAHMAAYCSPVQRHYVRILLMVPIYAVDAWCALRWKEQKVFFNTARECYEAFVIYSIFTLMAEFVGPRARTLADLRARAARRGGGAAHEHAHMLPPFGLCLRPWRLLDGQFLDNARRGAFQYVLVRVVWYAGRFGLR